MNTYRELRRVYRSYRVSGSSIARSVALVVWLAAVFALSACSTLTVRQVDTAGEITFQAAHLVDTLQTYHAATQDDCFGEIDGITRRIIGTEPSRAGVVAWGVGYGALHYGVTRLLLDRGYDRAAAVWEALTIETTGQSIAQNIHIGIRIGARNDQPLCHRQARREISNK